MSLRHGDLLLAATIFLTVVVYSESVSTRDDAYKYLNKFSYYPSFGFEGTLQHFQRYFGLKETGVIDKGTLETMSKPRCAIGEIESGFYEIDVLRGKKAWKEHDLTYKIANYPAKTDLRKDQVDDEIAKAFALWSRYSDLTFTRITDGHANITIRFVAPKDQINNIFNAPTVVFGFAHTLDEIVLNNELRWSSGARDYNLLQIMAHEIGHVLGIAHSDNKDSLMFPLQRPYVSKVDLDVSDIITVKTLHGTTFDGNVHVCEDGKANAIFKDAEDRVYIIKQNKYYELNGEPLYNQKPQPTSNKWPKLPNDIDAAVTVNGNTYFIMMEHCWLYDGKTLSLPNKLNGDYRKILQKFRIPGQNDGSYFNFDPLTMQNGKMDPALFDFLCKKPRHACTQRKNN